jgi:hypothetical protein
MVSNRIIGAIMAFAGVALAACADGPTATSPTSAPTLAVLADGDQVTGAIFTTLPDCSTTNGNTQYTARTEVYLNGGPQGGTALKDADYYVRVVEPDGTILGTSPSANYTVTGGIGPCLAFGILCESRATEVRGTISRRIPGRVQGPSCPLRPASRRTARSRTTSRFAS